MCALQRGLGKEHAVVGEDADRLAVDPGEAAHQRRAESRLEFLKLAAVDDAGDHFANAVGLSEIGPDDAVELGGIIERLARLALCRPALLAPAEGRHYVPHFADRFQLAPREIVRNAR